MKSIATPWRLKYILGQREDAQCIFCFDRHDDEESRLIVHRGKSCFVIMNLYPYTVGHLMVIPERHVSRLSALTDPEREEMASLLQRSEFVLRSIGVNPPFCVGINLDRAAGAGVLGHLHTHLVPLRGGETEERLLEPVEQTYRRLRATWTQVA